MGAWRDGLTCNGEDCSDHGFPRLHESSGDVSDMDSRPAESLRDPIVCQAVRDLDTVSPALNTVAELVTKGGIFAETLNRGAGVK